MNPAARDRAAVSVRSPQRAAADVAGSRPLPPPRPDAGPLSGAEFHARLARLDALLTDADDRVRTLVERCHRATHGLPPLLCETLSAALTGLGELIGRFLAEAAAILRLPPAGEAIGRGVRAAVLLAVVTYLVELSAVAAAGAPVAAAAAAASTAEVIGLVAAVAALLVIPEPAS